MSDREDYEENEGKKKGGVLATVSKVFTVIVLLAIIGCAAVFLCFHFIPQLKGKSLFTVTELVNTVKDEKAEESEAAEEESQAESEDSQIPEESSEVVSEVEEENTIKVFDGSEETIKNIVTYYRRGENVYEKEVETHKRIRRIIRYINKHADQVYFDGDYETWFEEYSSMQETEDASLESSSDEASETESSVVSSVSAETDEDDTELEKGLLLSEADFSENSAMTSESGYENADENMQDTDAETAENSDSSLTDESSESSLNEESSALSSMTAESSQENSGQPKILADITMKSGKRIQVYGYQDEDYGIMWGGLDTFAHATDDVD